ncbi:hypothetical protein NDU88_004181 [Pleurodeles waltl]|uniref:Uncharacterized protein n=1 Tax=Pleurodeles waltl TaxID=8319 RepID=A0AAV7NKA5_PLEWA|nr:hypothetical protein NDU88_004181 [Pleurodeles waltl]
MCFGNNHGTAAPRELEPARGRAPRNTSARGGAGRPQGEPAAAAGWPRSQPLQVRLEVTLRRALLRHMERECPKLRTRRIESWD